MEMKIVTLSAAVWILAGHLAFIDFELRPGKEQS